MDDQLVDLQLEMDTSNFGVKAIEEDKKRSQQKSKSSAKTKSVATSKSKKSSLPPKDESVKIVQK